MAQQKIRIRLKAYDHELVDKSARSIVETAERTGATISGPVPLPTEKNVYCVIKSPFKDKDSREHFEIRTHKRLIDIHQPTPKTVDSLMRMDSARGRGHRDQTVMKTLLGTKLGMTQLFERRREGDLGHRHPGGALRRDPEEDRREPTATTRRSSPSATSNCGG